MSTEELYNQKIVEFPSLESVYPDSDRNTRTVYSEKWQNLMKRFDTIQEPRESAFKN